MITQSNGQTGEISNVTRNIAAEFPGSSLRPNTNKDATQAVINELKTKLVAGDKVYFHVEGHSAGTGSYKTNDGYVRANEFAEMIEQLPPNTRVRVMHDVCWSGGLANQITASHVCVVASVPASNVSQYSSSLSYSRSLAAQLRTRNRSLLPAHQIAAGTNHVDNEGYSSLDEFLANSMGRSTDVLKNMYSQLGTLSDCEVKTPSAFASLSDNFRKLIEEPLSAEDQRTLRSVSGESSVTRLFSEWMKEEASIEKNVDAIIKLKGDSFNKLQRENVNPAEYKRIEERAERQQLPLQRALALSRQRSSAAQNGLRAAALLKFGSPEQKQKLIELMSCLND